MEIPTSREIELETLLRQRDAQLATLTDEVAHLRQYLANQPTPTVTEPISLPAPLVSLILPHIHDRSPAATSSDTVTTALTQRVKVLQEENDELYELLKTGETGRLKEDVRSLRRVVQKLEGALRESHQVITTLSEEVEKSQATILANGRSLNKEDPRTLSHSPISRPNHQLPPHPHTSANGGRPLPTGPRAHKKPRLSDTRPATSPAPPHVKGNRPQNNAPRRYDTPERSPRAERKPQNPKMEVDDDERQRARTPDLPREYERDRERERDKDRNGNRDREREPAQPRERERDRDRHRERDRDRDRDRGRDQERFAKRNGAYGGPTAGARNASSGGGSGGVRRGRRASNANSYSGTDRSLAERMGL